MIIIWLSPVATGVADHIERVLASLGKSSTLTIARARIVESDHLLKQATDDARKLGIFGARRLLSTGKSSGATTD